MSGTKIKKSYDQRTDIEKINSQWKKLNGLRNRKEWSAAVVRAATIAEIAANYAIRKEFSKFNGFENDLIDHFLKWANGIDGKINKLLIPLTKNNARHKSFKSAIKTADKINKLRNEVVHKGNFCNEAEATEIIAISKNIVETLVKSYDPNFLLEHNEDT